MVILGIGDGVDAGAALVIDDTLRAVEVQARCDGKVRSRGLPWQAIDAVLAHEGLGRQEVDMVGVAGRFTPPLFVRKHPELERLGRDAFSPALDVHVFVQAFLRQSGVGAYSASLAEEWFDRRFRSAGFQHQRLVMMDVHKCLAGVAYRCQSLDRVLVLSLQPMGDGVALAVHVGEAGQIDLMFAQRGFASLHVYQRRCLAAMGFRPGLDDERIWSLAAGAAPDPVLLTLLRDHLHVEGPRLSRVRFPLPARRTEEVFRALSEADPAVAAASVVANLRGAIEELVRHHVKRWRIHDVALAGSVFDDPRIVAWVGEMDEVKSVSAAPFSGGMSLCAGAAANLAGIAPRAAHPFLGPGVDDLVCLQALDAAGLVVGTQATLVERLAAGEALVRYRGRSGTRRCAMGARSVIVRADAPQAVNRVREALALPVGIDPTCLVIETANGLDIDGLQKMHAAATAGVVAPHAGPEFRARYPGVIAADGRVRLHLLDREHDPSMHRVIHALMRRTGCAAVAVFPLMDGDGSLVTTPADAVELWRRCEFDVMQLGRFYIQRGPE